jgi:hypothetical protein
MSILTSNKYGFHMDDRPLFTIKLTDGSTINDCI